MSAQLIDGKAISAQVRAEVAQEVAAFTAQTGHAPGPWVCRTFSATRICSAFEAWSARPLPPLASQVLCENCRPP